MTQTEFTGVLKDFLERSIGEAQRKRPDYAEVQEGRDDVLANFKEVGRRTGMTALQCAMVYFEKHLITLEKYARGLKLHSEGIDGRMVDLLNYLTLLNGIIVELRWEAAATAPSSGARADPASAVAFPDGYTLGLPNDEEITDDINTSSARVGPPYPAGVSDFPNQPTLNAVPSWGKYVSTCPDEDPQTATTVSGVDEAIVDNNNVSAPRTTDRLRSLAQSTLDTISNLFPVK